MYVSMNELIRFYRDAQANKTLKEALDRLKASSYYKPELILQEFIWLGLNDGKRGVCINMSAFSSNIHEIFKYWERLYEDSSNIISYTGSPEFLINPYKIGQGFYGFFSRFACNQNVEYKMEIENPDLEVTLEIYFLFSSTAPEFRLMCKMDGEVFISKNIQIADLYEHCQKLRAHRTEDLQNSN